MIPQDPLLESRRSILFMCLITLKSVLAGLVLVGGVLLVLGLGNDAQAATLKSLSVIDDDVIRVSDLFDGVDAHNGSTVLGHAPEAGKELAIHLPTLVRIASRFNIDWQPSGGERVVVRRDSHAIGADTIQASVRSALEAQGVEGRYQISLNGFSGAVTLPRNLPATAEVTDLKYTPGRNDFTATLATPSAANPVRTINISGVIEKSIAVPVVKSAVKAGELIGSTDLDWIDVSERLLANDTIVDADDLIGKTPTRILAMNTPVRIRDITNPQLVARGDDVTIIFNLGGMQLTAKGKAMQNGAEGDLVRAVNVTSNRSLTAMVTGDRTVTVQ